MVHRRYPAVGFGGQKLELRISQHLNPFATVPSPVFDRFA
jgi:hypothetical protein